MAKFLTTTGVSHHLEELIKGTKERHFSDEPSNGETSFKYPILKKNWKKAQEAQGIS